MAGFEWKYNLSGGRPLIKTFFMADTETLTKGDMVNLQTGEGDLAVTTDTAILGVMHGAENPDDEASSGVVAGTDSTTLIKVIVNPDAVYEDVDDTTARQPGATLDIAGTTGAQILATSSNTEFNVVERKRQATDPTRVVIMHALHPFNA
jgi:hypothetical protein